MEQKIHEVAVDVPSKLKGAFEVGGALCAFHDPWIMSNRLKSWEEWGLTPQEIGKTALPGATGGAPPYFPCTILESWVMLHVSTLPSAPAVSTLQT